MKELWNPKESVKSNLTAMGVAFDANEILKANTTKAVLVEKIRPIVAPDSKKENTEKSEVIRRLEAQVTEAEKNKKSTFRFTPDQVRWITYCLDKHGDNFKVIERNDVPTPILLLLKFKDYKVGLEIAKIKNKES